MELMDVQVKDGRRSCLQVIFRAELYPFGTAQEQAALAAIESARLTSTSTLEGLEKLPRMISAWQQIISGRTFKVLVTSPVVAVWTRNLLILLHCRQLLTVFEQAKACISFILH